MELRDPHHVSHVFGDTILADLAAHPREVALTRAESSKPEDDLDATLDGEELESEVQEALDAGTITRTVPGHGQGTALDPPRGPATPVNGARGGRGGG